MKTNKYPKTTKAAILYNLNSPLVISEIELPKELKFGQVLVKIHYSGICGSQIGEIEGVKGEDKFLPHLLGHEGSGTVLSTGPGVKTVAEGDKVVLHWRKGTGIESDPPIYKLNGEKINAGWVTTFNEYAIVSENRLTTIPNNSELDVASLFGCAVTTGFGVIENNAKLKIGESVVVYGAGGIGLNIIQAASLKSAYPIIAIDIHENRLELAKKIGATHVINTKELTIPEISNQISSIAKIDYFIDNTGNPIIIELGYKLLKSNGKIILVGVPKYGDEIKIYTLPLHFGKMIIGSHGGECDPDLDISRLNKMFSIGKIDFNTIITNTFTLNDINKAISQIKNGKIQGRCLIKMEK